MGVQAPSSRQNGLAILRTNARKETRFNHIVKEIRQHQIMGSKLEVWEPKEQNGLEGVHLADWNILIKPE